MDDECDDGGWLSVGVFELDGIVMGAMFFYVFFNCFFLCICKKVDRMHPKLLELSTKEKSLNTTLDGSPTTFF